MSGHAGDRTPWVPAGMELQVGDRVRVRLSGECRHWVHEVLQHELLCGNHQGRVGTVAAVWSDPEPRLPEAVIAGHIYFVDFRDWAVLCGSTFARAELERIEGRASA